VLDTGASRRRPDESRELPQRPGPGFHREHWISAGVYPDENRGRNDETVRGLYFMGRLELMKRREK